MTEIISVSRREMLKMGLSGVAGQALSVHSSTPMNTPIIPATVVAPVKKVLNIHEAYEVLTFFIRNRSWLPVLKGWLKTSE